MEEPRTYRSFLLTAWLESETKNDVQLEWRFGLEDVRGNHERLIFATIEEMMLHVRTELSGTLLTNTRDGSSFLSDA